MSTLEERTKDLLEPLIRARRTRPFSVPEQKAVAKWGYKTAIVLALIASAEERVVPTGHYREFYETEKPPDGTWIWIAGVAPFGDRELRAGWSQPERLEYWSREGGRLEPDGYRLSFSVLSVAFQVVWEAHGANLVRARAFRDMFTRIRPISKGEWPPRRVLTLAALDDLSRGRMIHGRP